MKLYVIVAREYGEVWVSKAWDEASMDEDPDLFNDDLRKAPDGRIVIVEVPDSFFDDVYRPPIVEGTVREVRNA